MSKALIFAVLFAGLPIAAYADEGGGAIGAIVRAPGEAAAGIVGGLTGTELRGSTTMSSRKTSPLTLGRSILASSLATFCRPKA
jgi:hypothetical protein